VLPVQTLAVRHLDSLPHHARTSSHNIRFTTPISPRVYYITCICYAPRRRGALSNTAIHPSVCPSPRRAAALGYRHADCLQLSHVRTADLSADGRRSAASRTAIGGGISSRAISSYRAITCSYVFLNTVLFIAIVTATLGSPLLRN